MAYRTFKRHLTAADRRAKVIIESCVESGAGIEYLTDAPRFRYTPAARVGKDSFHPPAGDWGRIDGGAPSKRGSISCGRGNTLKLKNWSPSKLDANPMYRVAMAGDDSALTKARDAWAGGNPQPLRDYLAKQAAQRREANAVEPMQLELKEAA